MNEEESERRRRSRKGLGCSSSSRLRRGSRRKRNNNKVDWSVVWAETRRARHSCWARYRTSSQLKAIAQARDRKPDDQRSYLDELPRCSTPP